MTHVFLIGAVLALLVSGCAAADEPLANKGDGVALEVRHVVDWPPLYVEGSIWHLRVVGSDGTVVLDRKLRDDSVSVSLERGRYELASEELPCNGNCSHLTPGTDSCSTVLAAEPGATITATVTLRPSKGCAIELEPQPAT